MAKVPKVQVNQEEMDDFQASLKTIKRLVSKLDKNFKLTPKEWGNLEDAGRNVNVLAHNIPQDIH